MPKIGVTQLAPVTLRNQFFYQHFNRQYFRKVLSIDPQNLVGYWPMWEASGSVAYDLSPQGNNGAYTGVTLKQPGIGDGRSCPYFDGENGYNRISSAGYTADVNFLEGTISIWCRVYEAGTWDDSTVRVLFHSGADVHSNFIRIHKAAGADKLAFFYEAGGTQELIEKTSVSPTDWFHLALTWSKANDEVKAYYDGSQEGSTQTGLGTWVGAPSGDKNVIGAQKTAPTNVWHGYLDHPVIWSTPLPAVKIARLAVR
jgi:hypothetical protein